MEKVLQILVVFGLLMLLIWRSIRSREERIRRFSFLLRLRPPLEERVRTRLIVGKVVTNLRVQGEFPDEYESRLGLPNDADAWLLDEECRLMLCYRNVGKLTIYRRSTHHIRELQELPVPMDCSNLAWDPVEREIYLEEDGDWFVYGQEEPE